MTTLAWTEEEIAVCALERTEAMRKHRVWTRLEDRTEWMGDTYKPMMPSPASRDEGLTHYRAQRCTIKTRAGNTMDVTYSSDSELARLKRKHGARNVKTYGFDEEGVK